VAAVAALAYDPAAPAADPKRVVLLAAALVALAVLLAERRAARPPAPAALWLGFVGWSAVTAAWGLPAGRGDLGAWVGASGLLVASLALPVRTARRAAGLAAALTGAGAAGAALVAAAAGARGFGLHGLQGNPNWLGLLLALSLPLTAGLATELRAARRRRAWLVVGAGALEAAGLVVARSRVAWVAAGAAALVLVAARHRRATLAAAALALALGATTLGPAGAAAPAAPAPAALSLRGRVWIWRVTLAATPPHLAAGAGLGRFAHVFLPAQGRALAPLPPRAAARRYVNATTAHDDWLQVVLESGLPALLLLGLAVGLGLARAAGRWPAGAAALAAVAVGAVGDSPLRQPAPVILLALTLAAVRDPAPAATPPARVRGAMLLAVMLLGATALLLATAVRTWVVQRWLTAADRDPLARLDRLERAAALDPGSGEAALALGLARLAAGDPRAALPELERSERLLADMGTPVAIGNAWLTLGDLARATAAYRRALAAHPGSFRARLSLAEALRRRGQLDAAAAELAVARTLYPGHPRLAEAEARLAESRLERATGGEEATQHGR
jgi:hypothetical protein